MQRFQQVQDKLADAFRRSPLAIVLTSAVDHRYIEVNEAFERITGWNRAEVIGRTPYDLGILVDPEQRVETVKQVVAEGTAQNVEFRFRSRNGDILVGSGTSELIEIGGEPCVLSVAMDITGLRKAEAERQLSEHRMAQFFETSPEYCYVVSPDGNILDINAAACNALGYEKNELVGRPLSTIYAPESRQKMFELFEKWKRTGSLRQEEMVILSKEGKKRTVLLHVGSVTDANGELLHSTSVQVDITERKQFEQSMFRRLEFDSHLSELSRGLISLPADEIDANLESGLARIGRFLEVDRITIFEFSPDRAELVRTHAWKMPGVTSAAASVGLHDLPWWRNRALRGEISLLPDITHLPETASAEKQYFLQKGIVSVASIPLRLGGEVVGAITFASVTRRVSWTSEMVAQLNVIGDIFCNALTRKRAMVALFASQRLVRESEERFRRVANTAPVMIWMSGADTLCTYFNQQWLEFTGRSIEAELGDGWAGGIHPQDLGHCVGTYSRAFDQRHPFEMEYRLRRYDGEFRWILHHGVPTFDLDGSFTGYIGSGIDVTERKHAEEALSTVSRRLIEAQEQERAKIARELHDDICQRLALAAMRLGPALEDGGVSTPNKVAEVVEQIMEIGMDVQALSHRLHSSKLEFLGLSKAAASVCDELSSGHQVTIDFQSRSVPDELPKDIAVCFFRILQEALRNAIKHSGSTQFQVSLTGDANSVQLTVRDSGKGFAPEALAGKGIGIVSMKERVKAVNGTLAIHSQPGNGTTVTARAPIHPRAMAAK
jgi:PAS domain S-box-containing protein